MNKEIIYVYGFEVSNLTDQNETGTTFTIKVDRPFRAEYVEGSMWETLKEIFTAKLNGNEECLNSYCLFTCLYSDFNAEYDQDYLEELRAEYCGSIRIENEYDRMSIVMNIPKER